jgi:hypothetical protein
VKEGPDLDRLLARALEAKRQTRQALARLPYEEKIEHWLRMRANTEAMRAAREAHGATGGQPEAAAADDRQSLSEMTKRALTRTRR